MARYDTFDSDADADAGAPRRRAVAPWILAAVVGLSSLFSLAVVAHNQTVAKGPAAAAKKLAYVATNDPCTSVELTKKLDVPYTFESYGFPDEFSQDLKAGVLFADGASLATLQSKGKYKYDREYYLLTFDVATAEETGRYRLHSQLLDDVDKDVFFYPLVMTHDGKTAAYGYETSTVTDCNSYWGCREETTTTDSDTVGLEVIDVACLEAGNQECITTIKRDTTDFSQNSKCRQYCKPTVAISQQMIAYGYEDTFAMYDISTLELRYEMSPMVSWEKMYEWYKMAFSPDGTLIALAGKVGDDWNEPYGQILLDAATGKTVWQAKNDRNSFDWVSWSPDGKTCAFLCRGYGNPSRLGLLEVASGTVRVISGPEDADRVDFSRDGSYIVSA